MNGGMHKVTPQSAIMLRCVKGDAHTSENAPFDLCEMIV